MLEIMNPTLIENTEMKKFIADGTDRVIAYWITPISGYVLHDKGYDFDVTDSDGNVISHQLGYRRTTASVAATYDFEANPREFYAVLEAEVPADNIFGVPDEEHEVM